MMVSSFDIFDTCVVRKCGAPKNLFDVLSYRVFSKEVSDEERLEFITCRLAADETSTLKHLYDTFEYAHPFLLSKKEIMQKELECEREMLVSVNALQQVVSQCRERGDRIIFISDMYLPTESLKEILSEKGFFHGNDGLYVSGDCGCKKEDGTLFQLIREQEHIEMDEWHHYGDNLNSDVLIPGGLGITTHPVNHKYLPYEQNWIDSGNDEKYHTGGIMAGIGRSISLSTAWSSHNAFAIDISAPLTAAFAMRIMTDAANRGVKRLYFCSRDCYALYYVAKRLEKVVPSVEAIYFHTSREALYDTKEEDLMAYLIHIGLACVDSRVGVVDIRSTGKSLKHLNEVMQRHGYNPVFGYYLEMFCSGFYIEDVPPYYCEINQLYCKLFTQHHPILEKFFSLCPEKRSVGYVGNNYILEETSQGEDYIVDDIEELSEINLSILCKYADYFVETELYHHSTEMFHFFVMPMIKHFFANPCKDYLLSLRHLLVLQEDGSYIPYIEETATGLSLKIAQKAQKSKIRSVRRLMKLIMRVAHIKPLPRFEWWPEGTKVYNS